MALRDEIQDLIDDAVRSIPAGRVFLEKGEEGLFEADVQPAEMLAVVAAVFGAHREGLMRLADEIDALRD